MVSGVLISSFFHNNAFIALSHALFVMRRRTKTKIIYGLVFFIIGMIVGLYVLPQLSFLPWYSGSALGEAKGEQSIIKETDGDVIKIGAILPLSGELASLGDSSRKAIELAIEDAGVSNVRVVVEDSKCSPREASTAVQKLISFDDVPIIIGDVCSSSTAAMIPTVTEQGVVLLSPASSDASLSNSSDFFFRVVASDLVQGRAMARFAQKELQYKNVAVLFVNNEYGVGVADAFTKEFQKEGTVVASEVFEPSSLDFRTQLTKIKATRPDAVYVVAYPNQASSMLKQVSELGLGVNVLASQSWFDASLLASKEADGVILLAPRAVNNVQFEQFRSSYMKKYGAEPSVFAAESYDAATLALFALKRSDGSSDGIKNAVAITSAYKGASGLITFDKAGDREEAFFPVIVKGSEFVQVPSK